MIRFFVALAASLSLTLAAPVSAQGPASDEAYAAARDLLIATDFDQQMRATTEQITTSTITTMMEQFRVRHGVAFPAGLEAELRQILREHNDAMLAATGPTALDGASRIYARYFTAQEIRELQRIQINPVMVKFQRVLPQFMAELMQLSVPELTRRLPELQRRIEAATRAWFERNPPPAEAPRT